jgi:hypothetical protein
VLLHNGSILTRRGSPPAHASAPTSPLCHCCLGCRRYLGHRRFMGPPPSSPSPRSKGARSLATARHRAACFIAHQWHTDICELLAHTPPRLSRGAWVHGAKAGGVAMGRGVSSARASTGKAKFCITLYDHINASQGAKYCMRNRKSLNV